MSRKGPPGQPKLSTQLLPFTHTKLYNRRTMTIPLFYKFCCVVDFGFCFVTHPKASRNCASQPGKRIRQAGSILPRFNISLCQLCTASSSLARCAVRLHRICLRCRYADKVRFKSRGQLDRPSLCNHGMVATSSLVNSDACGIPAASARHCSRHARTQAWGFA